MALECGALPVTRVEVEGHPAMVSFWQPNASDLEALAKGGKIMLWVYGAAHPVVAVGVEQS